MELVFELHGCFPDTINTAAMHHPDNLFQIFHEENGKLNMTEAPTPYGEFEDLDFSDPVIVGDRTSFSGLVVRRITRDQFWFVWESLGKILIAPWPDFGPWVEPEEPEEPETIAKTRLRGDCSAIYSELELNFNTTMFIPCAATALKYRKEWSDVWGISDTLQRQFEVKKMGHRFSLEIIKTQKDEPLTIYGIGFQFKTLKSKAKRKTVEGLLEEE